MYTYEKFNFRPFPWLLLILGIIFTFSERYIEAGILGTLGAFLAISFKGYSIDPKKRAIRKYDRFLWFYFGTWKPFSNPLYLTIVSIKISGRKSAPALLVAPGNDTSIKSYKINLIVDGKERYVPLMRGKRLLLIKEGKKIAQMLNIRLLDHTTSEKEWIT